MRSISRWRIGAERGSHHLETSLVFLADGTTQGLEDPTALGGADIDGQQVRGPGRPQPDAAPPKGGGHHVDAARRDSGARDFRHQRRGAAAGHAGKVPVDAALEAEGGLGCQTEAGGKAAYPGRVEVGGLQQHVRRRFRDLGVGASNHPGQGHGTAGVGDHQGLRVEVVIVAVEGPQPLSGTGPAHDDAALPQPVQVEGVQGLAELEHDEVGHVDDVVDRALADGPETVLQPPGRGADGHLAQDAGHVPGASLGVFDVDPRRRGRRLAALGQVRGGKAQPGARQGRHLPGDAHDAEAVGAGSA